MDTEKPHNEEEYWVVANAWNQAANRHADRDERRLGEIGMLARETIFRLRGLEALMPDYDADEDERIQRENKIKLGALLADAVEAGGHKTLRRTADAVKKSDAERPHPDLSPDGLSKK